MNSDWPLHPSSKTTTAAHAPHRFAYGLYATDVQYGTAALVTLRRLKQLSTRHDLDFIVLHLGLPGYLLRALHQMGATPIKVHPLRHTVGRAFRDCLVKLRMFELTQYERIVYLDVDTLPLKNLDPLFDLSFTEPLAAPRAYWLPQPWVSSLLLVIQPSMQLWQRVTPYFHRAAELKHYDMDILNLAFREEIHVLPDAYACLNSEWENRHTAFLYGTAQKTRQSAALVHFTALGKPWQYHYRIVPRLRPQAHNQFYVLWRHWWRIYNEIIHSFGPWARLQHYLFQMMSLKQLGLFIRHCLKMSRILKPRPLFTDPPQQKTHGQSPESAGQNDPLKTGISLD